MRGGAAALAAILLASGGAEGKDRRDRTAEARELKTMESAPLPGRLLAWAVLRTADGRRDLLFLTAPRPPEPAQDPSAAGRIERKCAEPAASITAEPRALHRWDAAARTFAPVAGELPADVWSVQAADLDGDSADETLLLRDDGIYRLEAGAGGMALVASEPAAISHGLAASPARGSWITLQTLGEVRFYGARDAAQGWGLAALAPLPLEVARRDEGLTLTSPLVRRAGTSAAGNELFAVGPQPHGARLRSFLLDPTAPPEMRRIEVWSRLPSAELVIESAYTMLDGRPVLVVVTRRADKLSLLEEKLLRVFRLDEKDRSRTGASPLLSVESRANLWQRIAPVFADVTGDGRQDLVAGFFRGLKEARLVLDVYAQDDAGHLAASPRSTEFDFEGADRSQLGFGDDLDGDGLADLLLRGKGGLRLHRGVASRDGSAIVSTMHALHIGDESHEKEADNDDFGMAFDMSFGPPAEASPTTVRPPRDYSSWRPIDLDADDRPELVRVAGDTLSVVRLTPR